MTHDCARLPAKRRAGSYRLRCDDGRDVTPARFYRLGIAGMFKAGQDAASTAGAIVYLLHDNAPARPRADLVAIFQPEGAGT